MKKERFIVVDVTLFFLLIQTVVIRMGLEPMTRSLEGCCSNPTELPNQPICR